MLAWMLAFAAGIYSVLQLSVLPPLTSLLLLPVLLLAAWRLPLLRSLCFCLAGCGWVLVWWNLFMTNTLPGRLEQSDMLVEGRIVSMPEAFDHYQRFQFAITHRFTSDGEKQAFPLKVRLSWYRHQQQLKPGQVWRFVVRLKRPHGFMNPGGFDYEAWLLRHGIRALGYVRDASTTELITANAGTYIERLRYILAEKIKDGITKDYQGLILALSIGDRSMLTPKQIQQLGRTGTSHLIAISGLHLGLVATLVFFLARYSWSRWPRLTMRMTAPMFATLAAFNAAVCYALVAGFSLPTQRALIMIGMVLLSLHLKQPLHVGRAMLMAAGLILLIDPMSIMAVDFWLSFSAVAFILYLVHGRRNEFAKARRWLNLQFALSLALFPLLIVAFNQVPLYSVFANMLAIPLIGLVVVPLALMAMCCLFVFPVLSSLLYGIIAVFIDGFWWFINHVQHLPVSQLAIPGPSLFTLICGVIGILILFMPRGLPARWLGSVFLLPLFLPSASHLDNDEFDFVLLDVGQGLSAVIRTRHHNLLFDTGARFSERFNIGDAVIVPYFKYVGITKLDMLIVSHGDNDHIGGVMAVTDAYQPDAVLTSVPEELAGLTPHPCRAGLSWVWDGVRFEILHPELSVPMSGNNASCVLKVSSPHGSVLLTGDIEKRAEQQLLTKQKAVLPADILIVPHHGSRTSSSPDFIDAVDPAYAFFAAGYKNRFGLPKQDILSRYNDRDIATRVSSRSGALLVHFRQDDRLIREYRLEKRRFWHNRVRLNDDHLIQNDKLVE